MAEQAKPQETQSDFLYEFLAWLEMNWKLVAAGFAVVALLGAGFAVYKWQTEQREQQANEALFALPSPVNAARAAVPPKAEAFAKVAEEFENTSAGERAELLAAGVLFSSGEYSRAQSAFEKFVNGRPESPVRSQASFGIAAALEAQGKIEAAMTKYQEVAQQYPAHNVASFAKLARGRIFEAQGKPEEALKIYSDLEKATGTGAEIWRPEAADRREKLLARHPALAGQAASAGDPAIEVTTPPAQNDAPVASPGSAPTSENP